MTKHPLVQLALAAALIVAPPLCSFALAQVDNSLTADDVTSAKPQPAPRTADGCR